MDQFVDGMGADFEPDNDALPSEAPTLQTAALQAAALQAATPRRAGTTADAALSPPRGLRVATAPAPSRATATVWFDHTDLAHYFSGNRMPTGIQRVEIELYRAVRRRRDEGLPRAASCVFDPGRRTWVVLPHEAFAPMCDIATDGTPIEPTDEAGWAALVAALPDAVAAAPVVPFQRDDVLVTVGASWWIQDYLQYVRHLQQARGVLYAPFLHDCIPLIVPHTCAAELVAEFRDWFAAVMHTADLSFANSRCTAQDVVRCAGAAGLPVPAPHVVRLDAHAGTLPSGQIDLHRAAMAQARFGLRDRFALFVATVEARKEHIFVFQCWAQMVAMYGADAIPDLVCVGKRGWLVEFTLNWLQVNPAAAAKIRMVGTVSDEDLAGLYGAAEFCVYNSSYEGWGLPVTEGLCHGRVPLIPRHSSLPEAGGAFAVYFEPGSRDSFIAQAVRLLDPVLRTTLENRIRTRFRPRNWPAVLEQILGAAARAPAQVRGPASGIRLEQGAIYSFARRTAATPVALSRAGKPLLPGAMARHGLGWWLPEDWGCWSRLPTAQLLFSLDPLPAERTIVYMIVRCGPAPQSLEITAGRLRLAQVHLQPHKRQLLALPLTEVLAATGDVMIALSAATYSLADYTGGQDARTIGFGLEALAVIEARDTVARADICDLVLTPH